MESSLLSLLPVSDAMPTMTSAAPSRMNSPSNGPARADNSMRDMELQDMGRTNGTQRGERSESAQERSGTEGASFRETLERVTGERPQTKRQNESEEVASIEKKIETVQKKLDQIAADPALADKVDVAKLKTLLEQLTAYLKQTLEMSDASHISVAQTGGPGDFMKLMESILDQLDKLLEDPSGNASQIAAMLQTTGAKMDEGFAKAQTAKTELQAAKGAEIVRTADAEQTVSVRERVTVRDFRTEQVVSKPKDAAQTATVAAADKKSAVPVTAEAARLQPNAVQAADAQNARETAVVHAQQTVQTSARMQDPATVYTSASGSVSRANIEALMQSVSGKAMMTLRDGNTEFKMRLFPPELGSMNMKFVLEDGILTGKVVVSTQEAKMLFDQNQQNLQQSLAQAGIQLGGLDVSFAGSDGQGADTQAQGPAYSGAEGTGLSDAEFDELAADTAPYLFFNSRVNYIA